MVLVDDPWTSYQHNHQVFEGLSRCSYEEALHRWQSKKKCDDSGMMIAGGGGATMTGEEGMTMVRTLFQGYVDRQCTTMVLTLVHGTTHQEDMMIVDNSGAPLSSTKGGPQLPVR